MSCATAGVAAKASGDSVTCRVAGRKMMTPSTFNTQSRDYYFCEMWNAEINQSEMADSVSINSMQISMPPNGITQIGFGVGQAAAAPGQTALTSPYIKAIGSVEYLALEAILARMDADVVCFQELQTTSFAAWSNLASELGYSYAAISGNGPFSGSLYNGYFSRFPIRSSYNVNSPSGAVELTRYPFRAVVDVPDALHPLVLWTMHHKSSATSIDKFRRAIEAYRIAQDVDAYLAANPDDVEYVLTGDMNDDIRDSQTPAQFASQPSGAPGGFVLGADISFPVAYATFPVDRYAAAGNGR